MRAEQGYFTRANRSKFTNEAGFAVADASDGINRETADLFIRSVGEAVVFDQKEEGEKWMYAVLPSRIDGRLSVTWAFPTSDGRRACHFTHTYLFDESDAKKIIRDEPHLAQAVRLTDFCNEYIGEPVGLQKADIKFSAEYLPENIKIGETGFDRESLQKLLHMLVLLHENRGERPAFLRSIFIVHECAPDIFTKRAFKLAALLYSGLPYIIASKLGIVIKTESVWRKSESYPSGFRSAYIADAGEDKNFIPGGELYIINKPLIMPPENSAVFTVTENDVQLSTNMDPNAAYKNLVSIIAQNMNQEDMPGSELREFYKFITDIVDDELSFRDMNSFYNLIETLRNPIETIRGGWKPVTRALRLLNAALGLNFKNSDVKWSGLAKKFIDCVLREDFQEPPAEDNCILLFDIGIGLFTGAGETEAFIVLFYKFIVRCDCINLENKKFLSALRKHPAEFGMIIDTDASSASPSFINLRDGLAKRSELNDIDLLINFFDKYSSIENIKNDLFFAADKLLSGDETKAPFETLTNVENPGLATTFLKGICSLKRHNTASPADCTAFFIKFDSNLLAKLDSYPLVDPWCINYLIFKIYSGEPFNVPALINKLKKWHEKLLGKNDAASIAAVERYRNEACNLLANDINTNTRAHMILMAFFKIDDPAWTVDWNRLIENVASFKINAFFFCVSKLQEYQFELSYKDYIGLFDKLKNLYSNNNGENLEYEKQYRRFLAKRLEDPNTLENSPWFLLIASLYGFVSRTVMNNPKLSSRMSYETLYCKNCHFLTPVTVHNKNDKKIKCDNCDKNITPDEDTVIASIVGIITMNNATAKKVLPLHSSKSDEKDGFMNSITSLLGRKDKDRDDLGSFDVNVTKDAVEINIDGATSEAEKFLSKDFTSRRKSTCIVLDGGE
ncbi:MAG: hypothetical protein FWE82_07375, partial [Defluviitaleaceae bacterium]|nr:hypothetical protein [Defluviitaleaceae bacterium]